MKHIMKSTLVKNLKKDDLDLSNKKKTKHYKNRFQTIKFRKINKTLKKKHNKKRTIDSFSKTNAITNYGTQRGGFYNIFKHWINMYRFKNFLIKLRKEEINIKQIIGSYKIQFDLFKDLTYKKAELSTQYILSLRKFVIYDFFTTDKSIKTDTPDKPSYKIEDIDINRTRVQQQKLETNINTINKTLAKQQKKYFKHKSKFEKDSKIFIKLIEKISAGSLANFKAEVELKEQKYQKILQYEGEKLDRNDKTEKQHFEKFSENYKKINSLSDGDIERYNDIVTDIKTILEDSKFYINQSNVLTDKKTNITDKIKKKWTELYNNLYSIITVLIKTIKPVLDKDNNDKNIYNLDNDIISIISYLNSSLNSTKSGSDDFKKYKDEIIGLHTINKRNIDYLLYLLSNINTIQKQFLSEQLAQNIHEESSQMMACCTQLLLNIKNYKLIFNNFQFDKGQYGGATGVLGASDATALEAEYQAILQKIEDNKNDNDNRNDYIYEMITLISKNQPYFTTKANEIANQFIKPYCNSMYLQEHNLQNTISLLKILFPTITANDVSNRFIRNYIKHTLIKQNNTEYDTEFLKLIKKNPQKIIFEDNTNVLILEIKIKNKINDADNDADSNDVKLGADSNSTVGADSNSTVDLDEDAKKEAKKLAKFEEERKEYLKILKGEAPLDISRVGVGKPIFDDYGNIKTKAKDGMKDTPLEKPQTNYFDKINVLCNNGIIDKTICKNIMTHIVNINKILNYIFKQLQPLKPELLKLSKSLLELRQNEPQLVNIDVETLNQPLVKTFKWILDPVKIIDKQLDLLPGTKSIDELMKKDELLHKTYNKITELKQEDLMGILLHNSIKIEQTKLISLISNSNNLDSLCKLLEDSNIKNPNKKHEFCSLCKQLENEIETLYRYEKINEKIKTEALTKIKILQIDKLKCIHQGTPYQGNPNPGYPYQGNPNKRPQQNPWNPYQGKKKPWNPRNPGNPGNPLYPASLHNIGIQNNGLILK